MVLMKIVEKDRTSNTISKAFIDVINAFFMSNQIAFNVVILKPMSASYAEVVDKTLTEMKDNQPIYIRNIDLTKGRTFNTSLSTVFFTKNANILQFATKVVSTDPRNLKLLIYAPKCNEIKDRTTSILLKNNSTNIGIALYSYFFCQHENTLMLLTWEWYTAKNACNKRKLFLINQFNMQTGTWKKSLKNYKKFHNFHKCVIRISYPSTFFHKIDNTGKMREAFKLFWIEVAKYANFKIELTSKWEKDTNIEIMDGHLTLSNQDRSITSVFWSMNVGLVITKGERYTQYEKSILPFDEITWILLIFTLSTAFFTIFFLNLMNKNAQNTVFGEDVNVQSLNVISTFFGIPQAKMPKKSFTRFILIIFMVFCFIIRTVYQGVLFDLINTDKHKPHAKTIAEVFEKNYKVLGHKTYEGQKFKESIKPEWREKIDETSIIPYRSGYEKLCHYLEKDESNIAIVMHEPLDMFAEFFCKIKLLKIKESVFNIPQGFGMASNHYLYPVIEKFIPRMFEAGIMKYLYDIWLHWRFLKEHFYENNESKALTIKDLGYGFNIWLITCATAIIVFFMEIIVWKFEIWKEKRNEKLKSIQNENIKKKIDKNLSELERISCEQEQNNQ